ncbi:MAG: hypothetical protein EOO08_01460 [Chitinophagaceae bacterium]|nr:MAG: hypothetical protein EOO08_01460 [Chitinophagaceae bacterium]
MKIFAALFFLFASVTMQAQGNWKLTRDKEGIRVYESDGSGFRNIKVECTLAGTLAGFENTLRNVGNFHNWVYANKTAGIIRGAGADEYYYYSETALPWPLQNRDAVIRARVERDPKGGWLRLTEVSQDGILPAKSGKVRIERSSISWLVTQADPGRLHIVYIFQADPGGSIPPVVANAFADKGPYESFRKLALLLKEKF